MEVDRRLVLVGLECYEIDAVVALGYVVHRASVGHPKFVAGGCDTIVFEFRHFEVFVHTQVADMRIALDAQIARHRAARFVEFLLQLTRKSRDLFDTVGVLGSANGRFHLPARQPERRTGVRAIHRKLEIVEPLDDTLGILQILDPYSCHKIPSLMAVKVAENFISLWRQSPQLMQKNKDFIM